MSRATNIARPVPPDFAATATTLTKQQLMALYGAGWNCLTRWLEAVGVTPPLGCAGVKKALLPDDYRAVAARLVTQSAIGKHYGVSYVIVRRWDREAGLVRQRFIPSPTPRTPTTPSTAKRQGGHGFRASAAVPRDTSRAGQAARFLQRDCPVYRCRPDGQQSERGTHWHYGRNTILTDAEIIARAERRGFDPDGWKRVAPSPFNTGARA